MKSTVKLCTQTNFYIIHLLMYRKLPYLYAMHEIVQDDIAGR